MSAARLEQRFGAAEATQLLPYLRSLLTEFYDNDVCPKRDPMRWPRPHSPSSHPELSDGAIEALAWSYRYDFS